MAQRRRFLPYAIPILIGAGLAALWVRLTGGDVLVRGLLRANAGAVALALILTASWLFLRFIRWQFLLRRVGVRIPIRSSFGSYLGALVGIATPAYVGEAIRGVFLRRRFGVPIRVTLSLLVLERLYDVAALGLLALATAATASAGAVRAAQVGVVFLALSLAVALIGWSIARRLGLAPAGVARLRALGTIGLAISMSVVAWSMAGLLMAVAARALAVSVPPLDSVRVFSTSTLLGAVTLLPAGVGATGSIAILELSRLGMELSSAVLVVSLVRLTSTGFTLTLGSLFLWRELHGRPARPDERTAHFDAIAEEYNTQWSPHVWDVLLERKLRFMTDALPHPPSAAGLGLDLGCGLGLQTAELRRRRYNVLGLDPSVGLLTEGRNRTGVHTLIAGSALALPFSDGSLDFVYAIGVLHHLPGVDAQVAACREIARVLKPGGIFFLHESNPRNPFFRFYMGYLFPILKSIDEGIEWWIDPRSLTSHDGMCVEGVRYFTFLPDFTPKMLKRPALAIERMLERGPTKPLSAHYMAILRRTTAPLPGTLPARVGSSSGVRAATAALTVPS